MEESIHSYGYNDQENSRNFVNEDVVFREPNDNNPEESESQRMRKTLMNYLFLILFIFIIITGYSLIGVEISLIYLILNHSKD